MIALILIIPLLFTAITVMVVASNMAKEQDAKPLVKVRLVQSVVYPDNKPKSLHKWGKAVRKELTAVHEKLRNG